jgi:hypothetical protein
MILAKTPAGQQVLKDRSIALSQRQRSVLILVDGKRSVQDILRATEAAAEDIDHLRALQLVQVAGNAQDMAPTEPAPLEGLPETPSLREAQERYAAAYPIAARLTSGLGLRGFRLNLAVEGATRYENLVALAPKILEAVGPEKFKPLHEALHPGR